MTNFGMQRVHNRNRAIVKTTMFVVGGIWLCVGGALLGYVLVSNSTVAPISAEIASEESPQSTVKLLVPRARIEIDTKLEPRLFTTSTFPVDFAPAGLLTADELAAVTGNYATRLLLPNTPFSHQDVSPHAPLSQIKIPAEHRAVTIRADARMLIDGFVRPRARVDVLWHYTNPREQQKVKTLVPFTKVLAINGSTDPASTGNPTNDQNTATLLVSRNDASKIELAQRTGTLSLALLGNESGMNEERTAQISLRELYDDSDLVEKRHTGRFITTNPVNGRIIEWQLTEGNWIRSE